MPLPNPQELQLQFFSLIKKFSNASESLDSNEQHRIAKELESIYNYMASQVTQSNAANLMYNMSANNEKVRKTLEDERSNFKAHTNFVECNLEKADQYLQTIQLAGYAVFLPSGVLPVNGLHHNWDF